MFSPQLPISVGRKVERGPFAMVMPVGRRRPLASSYHLGQCGSGKMLTDWRHRNKDEGHHSPFLIRGKGDSVPRCSRVENRTRVWVRTTRTMSQQTKLPCDMSVMSGPDSRSKCLPSRHTFAPPMLSASPLRLRSADATRHPSLCLYCGLRDECFTPTTKRLDMTAGRMNEVGQQLFRRNPPKWSTDHMLDVVFTCDGSIAC